MFSRHLLKAVLRRISLALALLIALQPLLQPGAINAANTPQTTTASLDNIIQPLEIAGADTAQQTQPVESAQSAPVQMAQALFDQVVRQAFQSRQWQVTALSNSLDWSAVQVSDSGVTGSGGWRIDALDESGQGAHIEGDLSFDLQVQQQTSSGLSQITGGDTLAGSTDVLQARSRMILLRSILPPNCSPPAVWAMARCLRSSRFDVSLTRNGTTTQVVNHGTGKVERPDYGVTRTTNSGTIDDNGKTLNWTSSTAVRDYGKGESEVWQELNTTQAGGTVVSKLDQHGFQRIAGTAVSHYVDRLNLTTGGKSYQLDKPGHVTGTMNGDFNSNLVLVSGAGDRIELSKPGAGARPPGLSSPLSQSAGVSGDGGGISPAEAAILIAGIGAGLLILGPGAAILILAGEAGLGAPACHTSGPSRPSEQA